MKSGRISEAVIRRLPRYYRHLNHLNEIGVERISSGELAKRMRLNASQIRQDFNCFGGFGQQGYGYHVATLLNEVKSILTIDVKRSAIIVGAGNLGQALCNFGGFAEQGVEIKALFDINPNVIGTTINNKPVYDVATMKDYIKENGIEIGIITARKSAVQSLVNQMMEGGIKGIWNFAPVDVMTGEKVAVENVHLADYLSVLAFKLGQRESE